MNKIKSIIKGMGRKIKKCYDAVYKKAPYIEPALIISGSLLVSLGIFISIKGALNVEVTAIESNEAEIAFYNNDYESAINEYEKLQKGSDWPFWEVKISEVYSIQGKFEKSNELLNSAMKKRNKILSDISKENYEEDYKEKDREFINYVVFTYFMNEEYEEALHIAEEFIAQNGKDKTLMRTMYTIYMVDNKNEKAEEIVDTYEVDNESAYDLSLLAEMNMIMGDFETGFNLLNDAFNKDKNEIKVFDVISDFATYDKNGMLTELEEIVEENPNELAYKMFLAKIYSMESETSNMAMDILEELENEDVGIVQLKLIESTIYRNMGDDEKAKVVLEEAIKNAEDSFMSYYIEAWQSFNEKDYDKALELSKNSVLANRDYPNNYGILIPEILMAKQNSEIAESYFRTALQKEPFNYNIIIKVAEYYGDKSIENEKARRYYTLASKLTPNYSEIYYDLATIDFMDNNMDSAIENLNKAIEIDENNIKYHRLLGTVYLNTKEYDEAIESIRNAYALDENDSLTLNNAGVYYIVVEQNIERGMSNIQAAYDSINNNMDDETMKKILKNYNKAKKVYDEYNNGYESELKLSDFDLFY